MTAQESVEALCRSEAWLHQLHFNDGYEIAKARRDAIKAALVAHIENPTDETWRKLEEACRGR